MARATASDRLRIAVLRRLAEDGDWVAWDRLALWRRLRPDEIRKRRAATLAAARAGDPQAQWEVAYLLTPGRRKFLDPLSHRGLSWARRAGRAGVGYAAYAVALQCTRVKDKRKARRAALPWLRLGVQAGEVNCASLLGWFALADGEVRRARTWLHRATLLDSEAEGRAPSLLFLEEAMSAVRGLTGTSLRDVRRKARHGDTAAQVRLGFAYACGKVVPASWGKADRWFLRAARRGDAKARLIVASDVVSDGDHRGGWADSIARLGTRTALWIAARLDWNADGKARAQRALERLARSARGGCAWAALELAGRLAGKSGREREAAQWMRRAAEAGIAWGQEGLAERLKSGDGVRPNAREEVRWHRLAAAQGVPQAMNSLGVHLHEGDGVRRDDREAVRWYRRAAALGDPHAPANLGRCYRMGHGVRRDPRTARPWLERAALVHQNEQAARLLAEDWDDGAYGRADPVEAARWDRRAAALGDPLGLRCLGVAYHNGRGVERDWPFSVLLYRNAAALGDAWSTYLLGLCHRDGEGVPKDRRRARTLFRRAARMGERRALRALRALDGRGAPPDPPEVVGG